MRIENLGERPTWELPYCSALTGKCTRCVKECLCLSLSMRLSNPPVQSRTERGLFMGSTVKKKKKKENLNACQICTRELGSAAVLCLPCCSPFCHALLHPPPPSLSHWCRPSLFLHVCAPVDFKLLNVFLSLISCTAILYTPQISSNVVSFLFFSYIYIFSYSTSKPCYHLSKLPHL